MTNPNKTEIVAIIDRSGSMFTLKQEAINGFNSFLAEQRKIKDESVMTLVLFNEQYDLIYNAIPLEFVQDLNNDSYLTAGWTALYDAVAKTINMVGKRLAATPEHDRPGKVIVVILTDGQENRSTEYKDKNILSQMISHQEQKYNWKFIYLGSNQDAFSEAASIGIYNSTTYDASSFGTTSAFDAVGSTVAQYRHNNVLRSVDVVYKGIVNNGTTNGEKK